MKRIVLYLVLSISLFGKTLVVDQSFFSIYGTGINCEGFSVNTYETIQAAVDDAQDGDTIKVCPGEYNESINWNKQNISLIGTSGNRDDVLISQQDEKVLSILSWPKSVTIKNVTLESKQDDAIYVNNEPPSSALFENVSIKAGKNGIRAELYISDFHLKNSYIYSKNEKGVYFKDNTNGDFLIEGSLIESKEEGISVKNTNGEMKIYDSNIISSNEKCLEVDGSVQNGLELKNLILQGDKGVYIKNNLNGQILFQNISIQSSDESIQIDESISQQLKLKELNITSNNNNGVEVGGSLNGGLLLENSSITSNNSYGISIKKSVSNGVLINNSNIVGKDGSIRFLENVSGDITIQSSNFNSQNKKGIKFEKNINHKLTISQSIISSNDDSLSIDGSINGGLLIEDTNITSNSEDGLQVKGNIYGDIDGNYDLSIKNSNIKAKKRALNLKYEKQIDAKLENSYFESSNDDTVKLKLTDWKSVLATGNCFKTLGSGDYAFYLDMDNSNDVHINNNCFYATTIDRLAKSTSSGYDWDGNYWDGLTESSYNYNNVVDNNPLSSCQNSCGESNTNNNILQPIVNYQMDECRWDADSSTYEIKNSGTLSNDYNASSLNNADTTLEGVLCKAADIISNEDDDKAIETKTEVSLPTEYTLVTWVKFPLNTDGHKTFRYGAGPFAINIQYYNIADRVGSDNDFIYFTRNVNEDSWTLNVKDDNSKDSIDFNPQSLSGWHMLTFVVTNSGTEFYLDDSKNYTFSTHPNSGTLGLLFNSDYGSSDNDPNGQSIGAYVDEFKIFNQDIDEDKITEIYNNEKSGKNYDGSIRDCPSCATSKVPIAYYKMDECYWDGTEGEVKDSSGNEHNGTAKYGLNTDYGHLCLAGEFDGDNDYIDTGYDFYWSRDENFTITAWVYIDDVDEYEYIPVFSKMNRKEYSLMIGKRLRFLYRDNSEHDALFIWNTGTVFESKKWYQIAVVYDGETKEPKIYVNGKDDGTYIYKNDKDMSFGHTTETTKIGHGFAWGNEYFDGKIDEVRVYDAALSSDDINATYNDEKDGKVCEANNCLPKPIANWRLDECKWTGAEGEVRDTALSGFDGTVEGEANTIDGKKCKSGIFDGDNDYIEIPHDEGLNPSNNRYTIMAWVKTNDNFKTTLIAGKGDWRGHSIGQDKYHGWFTQFYFSDGSHSTVLWGNDKPEVGRWYHIAGVYDGSSVKLYIDGELANSENVSKELDKNSKPFWIAAAGWQKRFNGQIDEVKVFDENLSAEQIQRIYNNEDSGKNFDGGNRYCKDCSITLKLDYHLDECSEWIGEDGEIKDSSGNSYDGVAVNGAKNKDNGKVCKTSNLNEGRTSPGEYTPYNGKYINTKQNFQWDRDKSFTMMAWVYPRQQWCPIIAKVNPDYNHRDQKEFKLEVGVSNNVNRFRFEQTLEGHDYIHIYTAGQELNKWYHVAVVYDSDTRDIFLYLNGENAGHVYRNDKDKEFIHYNFPVTIGKGYSSYKDDELNYCDGMIDEIKIFDGALDHSMISIIYNREKSGKYWNSDEECPTCFSFKFDAWDTWRGDINDDGVIDDKNISTKVVYQDFNLSIASLSEDGNSLRDFNGTVCAILIDSNDKNYTSWKKMDEFTNDVNISNWTGIKVSKAVNQLKTKIVWKKDVNESCPLVEEDGNTTSTDEFAVRPNRFETYTISEVYSGEEFNITFNALDIGVNNVLDYNETRDNSFEVNVKSINNCIDNELNNSWSFSNGKYVYENVKFINVGEINITIKEINGSEFANVDADDTNDSDRFIEENITTIYVRPYELKVSEVQLKPSTQNGNWLYMAHELSDMNVESNVTIEALSKDGSLIEDFNDTCYDKNLVIKVKFDYFENNKDENISYLFDGNLTDTNEPNVTLQIPIYKFKEGIATASYKFGIDRDFSDPKNPLLLELREVNITNNDEIKAKVVNGMNITDENVTFYYGRIKFKDIRTTEKDINNTGYVLVYSENKLDGFIQYSSNWYINKNHSDIKEGNITNAEAHENTVLASSEKSDINISSEEPNEGKINITISHNYNESFKSYIHIDINDSKWLWYVLNGFGGAYSFDNNSDCTVHPCFEYEYINKSNDSKNGVISGDFNGSDFDLNISMPQRKRGVKIFR